MIGNFREEEPFMFTCGENSALQETYRLIQYSRIARGFYIMSHCVRHPGAIIGNQRTNTVAPLRQPPMLEIAFQKLPGSRTKQVLTHEFRR